MKDIIDIERIDETHDLLFYDDNTTKIIIIEEAHNGN